MTQYWYVAGPMRGLPEYNFPAFDLAEERLRGRGPVFVFNPARRDRNVGFDAAGLTGNEDLAELGFDLRFALSADTGYICDRATHVFMLAGWEDSMGARAEHALAQALGLEIEYEDPTNWLAVRDTPAYQLGYYDGYQDGTNDAAEGADYRTDAEREFRP